MTCRCVTVSVCLSLCMNLRRHADLSSWMLWPCLHSGTACWLRPLSTAAVLMDTVQVLISGNANVSAIKTNHQTWQVNKMHYNFHHILLKIVHLQKSTATQCVSTSFQRGSSRFVWFLFVCLFFALLWNQDACRLPARPHLFPVDLTVPDRPPGAPADPVLYVLTQCLSSSTSFSEREHPAAKAHSSSSSSSSYSQRNRDGQDRYRWVFHLFGI